MSLFQHKDRVVRQVNDQDIESINGSPRVYVINKTKDFNSLFAYPEVRLNDQGFVIRSNPDSKWNIGDRVVSINN